jgi:hypothetical protein
MCLDYIYLGIAHALREPMLMTSFAIKLSFIVIELTLIIVFRITEHTHYNQNNMAATLEWGMYFCSFYIACCAKYSASHRLCLHRLYSLFDRRPITILSKEPSQPQGLSTTRNDYEYELALTRFGPFYMHFAGLRAFGSVGEFFQKCTYIFLLLNEYQDFNFSSCIVILVTAILIEVLLACCSRDIALAVYVCSVLKDVMIGASCPGAQPPAGLPRSLPRLTLRVRQLSLTYLPG